MADRGAERDDPPTDFAAVLDDLEARLAAGIARSSEWEAERDELIDAIQAFTKLWRRTPTGGG